MLFKKCAECGLPFTFCDATGSNRYNGVNIIGIVFTGKCTIMIPFLHCNVKLDIWIFTVTEKKADAGC